MAFVTLERRRRSLGYAGDTSYNPKAAATMTTEGAISKPMTTAMAQPEVVAETETAMVTEEGAVVFPGAEGAMAMPSTTNPWLVRGLAAGAGLVAGVILARLLG